MTNTVLCSRYKKELPALTKPPFPGPKGLEIQQTVSAKAWQEWQTHQTRLINEKQLSATDKNHRKYLADQMSKFLNGEAVDEVEGYVPPAAS